jgi:hypothetical protein
MLSGVAPAACGVAFLCEKRGCPFCEHATLICSRGQPQKVTEPDLHSWRLTGERIRRDLSSRVPSRERISCKGAVATSAPWRSQPLLGKGSVPNQGEAKACALTLRAQYTALRQIKTWQAASSRVRSAWSASGAATQSGGQVRGLPSRWALRTHRNEWCVPHSPRNPEYHVGGLTRESTRVNM